MDLTVASQILPAQEGILVLRHAHTPTLIGGSGLNQRRDDFAVLLPLAESGVFERCGRGLETGRDAWVYNTSAAAMRNTMATAVETYRRVLRGYETDDAVEIKWTATLRSLASKGTQLDFDPADPVLVTYRCFFKQKCYPDSRWTHRPGVLPWAFPTPTHRNVGLYQAGAGSDVPFSLLMLDCAPDLHVTGAGSGGQFFPRYRYEQVQDSGMLDLGVDGEVVDGYRRIDNITDEALKRFSVAYPSETITKDDVFFYVYGVLHSPDYRETYAADLKKVLPRIPLVRDFRGYADAGHRLSELHLNYETVEPYPLQGLAVEPQGDPYAFFAVGDKKMRFGGRSRDKDRSVIHYNDRITLVGIPEDAYRYMLGSRSAIEWIIDRYYVKTDKASGIVNDPNDWSREVGDPRYILDLLARVVTVSVETNKLVDGLPDLDVIEGV